MKKVTDFIFSGYGKLVGRPVLGREYFYDLYS
jgi:hypothetical protein